MSQTPKSIFRKPVLWLLIVMAITTALYWQGFVGPFLMDDAPGLLSVRHWMEGNATLRDVLIGNTGWHTHRALAYATLAVNAAIGGFTPYSFKAGNLVVHLACGGLAFVLIQRLLRRDVQFAPNASVIACIVVAVWLLHPLNVSTVLYPIQRMAQVAMLMTLAGLLFYAVIRERMLDGRLDDGPGMLGLWLGIPLFTFLAIQGKQNAVVLPALCLVLELAWFQRMKVWTHATRLFYIAMVALPALAAALIPLFFQGQLDAAFSVYDFTATEKVLSAPRVLWDYVRMLLVPYSPSMGIFGDGFAASRSLTAPISTFFALLGLIAVSAALWALRRSAPAALAGWMLFLIGHAVEASYTPIELYYEHRNYANAIWLFLGVISLITLALSRLQSQGMHIGRVSTLLFTGILLVLSMQTLGRNLVWQDVHTLTAAAAKGNPESFRAVVAFASASANLDQYEEGFQAYERLGMSDDPIKKTQAALGKISLQCRAFGYADPADFKSALSGIKDKVDLGTFYMFHIINQQRLQYGCGPLTAEVLADGLRDAADGATSQPDTSEFKGALRYLASVFYANADLPDQAADQGILAWQPGADPEVGRQLVDSLIGAGRLEEAQTYLLQVAERTRIDLQAPAKPSRDVWGLWDLQRTISKLSNADRNPEPPQAAH